MLGRILLRRAVAVLVAAAVLPFFAAAQSPASGTNICAWDFLRPTLAEGSGQGGRLTVVETERTLVENLELVCTSLVVEDLPTALADDCVLTAATGALVCGAGGTALHAASHHQGGADALFAEALASACDAGDPLEGDGAGGVQCGTPAGGGGAAIEIVDLEKSVAQSLASGSTVSLIWQTELEDVGGYHAANAAAIVIPSGKAGVFQIECGVFFDSAAGGTRRLEIRVNGAGIARQNTVDAGASQLSASRTRRLAAANSVTCAARQDSGSALDVLAFPSTFFTVTRLGD